jgi:ABC-2 type transport system permease protein
MKKTLTKYLKIWWLMSKNAFMSVLVNRLGFSFFLTGKIIRFVFFFIFLSFILTGAKSLAGYSPNQVIFFFLTFNFIDILAQFLFREVYRFRPMIVKGTFDYVLSKPVNALFRALMGGADIIDLVTIPPLIIVLVIFGKSLNPSFLSLFFYLILILNGLLIATSFHIAVLALGIVTLEIDHTVMIYRDLTNLGRFPIDIYKQPLQAVLTYLVPVGLMVTLPSKALIGLISPFGVLVACLFGVLIFLIATRFWHFALERYTSASS